MVQTGKMAQATQNIITLKGSTKIVTEFFAYAVNRQDLTIKLLNLLAGASSDNVRRFAMQLTFPLSSWPRGVP